MWSRIPETVWKIAYARSSYDTKMLWISSGAPSQLPLIILPDYPATSMPYQFLLEQDLSSTRAIWLRQCSISWGAWAICSGHATRYPGERDGTQTPREERALKSPVRYSFTPYGTVKFTESNRFLRSKTMSGCSQLPKVLERLPREMGVFFKLIWKQL